MIDRDWLVGCLTVASPESGSLVLGSTHAACQQQRHNGHGHGSKGGPGHPQTVSVPDGELYACGNGSPALDNDGSPDGCSDCQAASSSQTFEGGKGKAESVGEETGQEGQTGQDGSDQEDDVCDSRKESEAVIVGDVAIGEDGSDF